MLYIRLDCLLYILTLFLDNPDRRVVEWAKNKQNTIIASSICVAYSKMDRRIWGQERVDTNSNEQSGWKSQSLGKALDLPMAVQTYVPATVHRHVLTWP